MKLFPRKDIRGNIGGLKINTAREFCIPMLAISILIFTSSSAYGQGGDEGTNHDPMIIDGIRWEQRTSDPLVTFEIMVEDPDSDPMNVTFDFGDGSPPLVKEVRSYTYKKVMFHVAEHDHMYDSLGKYEVTVNVSDGRGGYCIESRVIEVVDDPVSIEENVCYEGMILPLVFLSITFFTALLRKKLSKSPIPKAPSKRKSI